jgi:PAS domain S-box-containing protein
MKKAGFPQYIEGAGPVSPLPGKTRSSGAQIPSFRESFNDIESAILIRDIRGNIVEANPAMARLTGYTIKELKKMNLSQFLSKESYKLSMEGQQQQLMDKIPSRRSALTGLIKKNGERVFVESLANLIVKNGQLQGFIVILRNKDEEQQWREDMRSYVTGIIRAQEEERKRIARELHDDIIQSLLALMLDIEALANQGKLPKKAVENLLALRSEVDGIAERIGDYCHKLRPDILALRGLLPTLSFLVDRLKEKWSIDSYIKIIGNEQRLSPESELLLFRITQEALSNARKHAQATEIATIIKFGRGKISLSVIDNGKGFKVPEALVSFAGSGKFGLVGMQERALLLGGSFSIKSREGKGTKVTIKLLY